MTSTPLPEQGGFNERLDDILFDALEDAASYTHKVTAEEADYIQSVAKDRIRTLIAEEIIGEHEPSPRPAMFDDFRPRYARNILRAEQRKKLGRE